MRRESKECSACDHKGHVNAPHDFCDVCNELFVDVMKRVKCAERGEVCTSPVTCLGARRCVQLRAAMVLVKNS